MSSSEGDGSVRSPPATQYSTFDAGLDLDNTFRRNRDESRRQRTEKIERRRREKQKQAARTKRQQLKAGKNDDDNDEESVSSSGSADLLAGGSPEPESAPSSPSPPSSPIRKTTSRISNRSSRSNGGNAEKPLASASGRVNSNRFADDSPSSILKSKKGRGRGSPNRVAFKIGNNQSKKFKPLHPDSDDEEDCNAINSTKPNGATKASSKPAAPEYEKWKPKWGSDSDEYSKNTSGGSIGSKNGGSRNASPRGAAARSSPAQEKKPFDGNVGSDSDSDYASKPLYTNKPKAAAAAKVTNDRVRPMSGKTAAARKFSHLANSSSDSDGEDFAAGWNFKRKHLENQKIPATTGKAEAAKSSFNANTSRPTLQPSPLKKKDESLHQHRPKPAKASPPKRSRMERLAHDTDSDDSDVDEGLLRTVRENQLKKKAELQAEEEAHKRHNPLAIERREQEKREEREQQIVAANAARAKSRTHAGAGGLEGTEIMVGDQEEIKSISDMGDEGNRGRRRKSETAGGEEDEEEFISRKQPSRGTHKRRSGGTNHDDLDDDESPNKKQRYSSLPPLQNEGARMQFSDNDGLWDDSDDDGKKKKGSDDSDSDDGAKKKRGRGRPRTKRDSGSTQQKKRGRKPKASASKPNNSSDDNSDAPAQKKKPATKKTARLRRPGDDNGEPKKRSPNGSSRWASRFGNEDDGDDKSDVSDDELERREAQLQPDFPDPKLGPPGELVPFVLSPTWERGDPLSHEVGQDAEDLDKKPAAIAGNADDDQVPAATNRYLQDYQRMGIQFIYSSIIHGKGCVLGDDMGLGKTVQIISLLSALLKKTGTGLDELGIKQHRRKITKLLDAKERSRHQALLTGTGFAKQEETALETVEPPDWTPILIIVPPSVAENWQKEFKSWGHFNVGYYHGSTREKALDRIRDGLDAILIVGKSLFIRAGDYDQLASIKWKLVIVDEFHEFKNGKGQSYMRLADLRDNAECPVIGMTGTLMQNNHDELYYLIDLVRPFLLGSIRDFRNEVSKPMRYARSKDAKEEVNNKAEEQGELLRNLMKPAYLERKKEDVLKDTLTKKRERVVFCELTDIQKKIYRHIITLPDYELLRFANAPCECGVNKGYFLGFKKMRTHQEEVNYQRRFKEQITLQKKCCYRYPWNPDRHEPGQPPIDPDAILWMQAHEKPIGNPEDIAEDVIDGRFITCQNCPTCITLPALNKLYKVASHPSLLQVDPCESEATARKKLEFAKVALPPEILRELPGGTYYKGDGIMDDHIRLSGKMKSLDYLLKKYLKRRNRVLVFSYSTQSLDVIQHHIKTKGWTNIRLDGKTQTSQRQSLVDQFQKGDIEIFLISTKAGGLGLNLTAANKVIIFDVNWNPSYDEQAQDRAYRIGQKRDVETVRLVARGTIEELMYARQVYKVQLKKQTLGHNTDGKAQPKIFRGVAKDKNRKGELFGIENLLKFKDGSFMQSVWKKSDDPHAEHDTNELAEHLENVDEDQLQDIAELGDEGPQQSKRMSQGKSQQSAAGIQEEEDSSDDDGSVGDNGIDHGDLFAASKGGARIAPGDEGFDEEMGGASQMFDVRTKMVAEQYESEEEEEEEEEDEAPEPDDPSKPDPATSIKGESDAVAVPLGAKSSSNDKADDDDDATVDFQATAPSPVQSGAHKTANEEESPPRSSNKNQPEETNEQSPARSTGEDSIDSWNEGLRTQPTTQNPTPKDKAPKKKSSVAKVSIMGNIFTTQKKKPDQSDQTAKKKKAVGLYMPSYNN